MPKTFALLMKLQAVKKLAKDPARDENVPTAEIDVAIAADIAALTVEIGIGETGEIAGIALTVGTGDAALDVTTDEMWLA